MDMRRFCVWGIGERGKCIAHLLSQDKLVVYVDADEKLQGTYYRGTLIVSPEEYYEKYLDYPLIVTPEKYEEQIMSDVTGRGAQMVYSFNESYDAMLGLQIAPLDKLLDTFKSEELIYLYGNTPMAILLYDILADKGISAEVVCAKDSVQELDYLEKYLQISTCLFSKIKKSRVLLTMPVLLHDKEFFEEYEGVVERYYDLVWHKELYGNHRIELLKNIHKGQRCFIIGNGPSLRVEDLEMLKAHGEICFGMNRIMSLFGDTTWRPDYYVVADDKLLRWFEEEIYNFPSKKVLVADRAMLFKENTPPEQLYVWHAFYRLCDDYEIQFSDDFSQGSYCGKTVTYDCMQLAIYMGFSEVYLLGVDMSQGHFYSEEKDTAGGYEKRVLDAYIKAKEYLDQSGNGQKIYNATRGGYLEVFERVNFDTLFDDEGMQE